MSRFAIAQKQSPHKSASHPVRQSRLAPAGNQTHPLLNLQRKIGNQALMRLLASRTNSNATAPAMLQAKLTVSEPEDVHEQEAERISNRLCECLSRNSSVLVNVRERAIALSVKLIGTKVRCRRRCSRSAWIQVAPAERQRLPALTRRSLPRAGRSILRLAPSWSRGLDRIFHTCVCTPTRRQRDRPMT